MIYDISISRRHVRREIHIKARKMIQRALFVNSLEMGTNYGSVIYNYFDILSL
jgi:hypothetical protein